MRIIVHDHMRALDGRVHEATGKTFELEFCTVAGWTNGEIVDENLFCDQVRFFRRMRSNISAGRAIGSLA